MILSNKYNVPQQTIDKMVKDGIIPANWPAYEEVYSNYLELKNSGKTRTQIYLEVAEKSRMSQETVKKIILRLGKM